MSILFAIPQKNKMVIEVGKQELNFPSVQEELSWYLSTLEILKEGIDGIKKQREFLEVPLDFEIDLTPNKKNENLSVIARKAEEQLKRGAKDPVVYLYKKLAVDHFRELEKYLENNVMKNKKVKKFISSTREQKSLVSFVYHMIEGLKMFLFKDKF